MPVLVYVEDIDGRFQKSAFETVSYAREVARQAGTSLTAVTVGNVPDSALEELGQYGASRILNIHSEKLRAHSSQTYASVLAQAARAEDAGLIILSSSFSGKGLAPRLAIRLGAALIPDVTGLPEISGQRLSVKRNAFSGKAFATVASEADVKILTLSP
ncbi:MAG TPA: electron transfer flavoprotein subunit alpha/FixB family protein, partial [Anseongella sp.]|nr:electron transfer flavoprotein subunit alpha/FixB family protein [Anseongella sp.]